MQLENLDAKCLGKNPTQLEKLNIDDTNVDNYTRTTFSTEKIFQEFLDLQKSKSIYNFNVDVTSQDKILTLTTCTEKGTKRLVVHAKLIK